MNILSFPELNPANTSEAFQKLCKTSTEWIIRSNADVEALIGSQQNPWKNVPLDALKTFVNSLEFKNGGLAHSKYSSLEDYMNVRDFFNMWAYFGIGRELFIQEADKKCESP